MYSSRFAIICGVRQGNVLSPFVFNIYVDNLFRVLEVSGYGRLVWNTFFGCVMYADDF